MSEPHILDNRIVVLVARKGSGKSFQMKKQIREEPGTIVIFDPQEEYRLKTDLTVQRNERVCDYTTSSLEELEDRLRDAAEDKKGIVIAYVPDYPEEEIDDFCKLLFN